MKFRKLANGERCLVDYERVARDYHDLAPYPREPRYISLPAYWKARYGNWIHLHNNDEVEPLPRLAHDAVDTKLKQLVRRHTDKVTATVFVPFQTLPDMVRSVDALQLHRHKVPNAHKLVVYAEDENGHYVTLGCFLTPHDTSGCVEYLDLDKNYSEAHLKPALDALRQDDKKKLYSLRRAYEMVARLGGWSNRQYLTSENRRLFKPIRDYVGLTQQQENYVESNGDLPVVVAYMDDPVTAEPLTTFFFIDVLLRSAHGPPTGQLINQYYNWYQPMDAQKQALVEFETKVKNAIDMETLDTLQQMIGVLDEVLQNGENGFFSVTKACDIMGIRWDNKIRALTRYDAPKLLDKEELLGVARSMDLKPFWINVATREGVTHYEELRNEMGGDYPDNLIVTTKAGGGKLVTTWAFLHIIIIYLGGAWGHNYAVKATRVCLKLTKGDQHTRNAVHLHALWLENRDRLKIEPTPAERMKQLVAYGKRKEAEYEWRDGI